MLNVHDLERRWIKYKIKSLLPLVFFSLIVISIVLAVTVYMPIDEPIQSSMPMASTKATQEVYVQDESTPQNPVTAPISVPQNTQAIAGHNQQATLVLKPSLRFMDNIENSISPYMQNDQYQVPSNEVTYNTTLNYQSNGVIEEQGLAIEEEVQENKLTLNVSRNKSDADLKDVIRRFKNNKNPTLSLFIAKHYYNAKQYQKSYNYALMTNEIDKSIEESWIIFSKSLVKLGQSELAINTLKSYLKTSKSSAATVLLRKIESGSFK